MDTTEPVVNSENAPATIPAGLEAIIAATVEKTIMDLLEHKRFGKRGRRDRSRSRSRSRGGRSRSRSRGDRSRSGSRGRRSRSGSQGRHFRSECEGKCSRSGSRSRGKYNWEEADQFFGPPHRFHHFHHNPPPCGCLSNEMMHSFGRGRRGGKFGKRFHRGYYLADESDKQNNENSNSTQDKNQTPAPEQDIRNDFEHLDVEDVLD